MSLSVVSPELHLCCLGRGMLRVQLEQTRLLNVTIIVTSVKDKTQTTFTDSRCVGINLNIYQCVCLLLCSSALKSSILRLQLFKIVFPDKNRLKTS